MYNLEKMLKKAIHDESMNNEDPRIVCFTTALEKVQT